MARACSPPAREPVTFWLARRSTMATSTPANASSPASISPVGPPPAITTAWLVLAVPVVSAAREPLVDNNALISGPRRLWLRPAVLRDEAGLEASPLQATY